MNSDKTRQTNQTQPQQTQEQQAPAQELSDELLEKFQGLKRKLAAAQEREKRSLADYQNLLRRTRQERTKAVKLANQGLITELLPALENLDRAAQQIAPLQNGGCPPVLDGPLDGPVGALVPVYGLSLVPVRSAGHVDLFALRAV